MSRKPMTRQALLAECEELIKTFNPARTTLESHADERISVEVPASDAAFLREVLYGAIGRKAALKAFMVCFFHDRAAKVLRSDYTLYMILAYLAIFRLKELTVCEFKKFAAAVDADKMTQFLTYAFDAEKLRTSGVARAWAKIYDPDYVEGTLLADLVRAAPAIDSVVDELRFKALGLAASKAASEDELNQAIKSKKQSTVPNPPNLTKPNPRRVPEPRAILQYAGAARTKRSTMPVDDEEAPRFAHYAAPVWPKKSPTAVVDFKLHETRSNLAEVARFVEDRFAASMDFDRADGAVPGRMPTSTPAAVKLNTAAILREDALFRAKQAKEAAKIEAYESELRDSTEFVRWQNKMRDRDAQVRLEQISRTRVLAKASADEAAQAKYTNFSDNLLLAQKSKAEALAMEHQRRLEDEHVLLQRRHVVKHVREVEKTLPAAAMERVTAENDKIRRALQADLGERLAFKKVEDEVRAAELAERVKKSKAERVLATYVKIFDPADPHGLGLLDEMSLVEMQERLGRNRELDDLRRGQKRDEITFEKQQQREKLAARLLNIRAVRDAAAAEHGAAAHAKAARDVAQRAQAQQREDSMLTELVGDLAQKRARLAKRGAMLAASTQREAKDRAFAGQGDDAKKRRHTEELLRAAERRAEALQTASLDDMATYEATKAKDRALLERNAATAARARRAFLREQTAHVAEIAAETTAVAKDDIRRKKHMYTSEKAQHAAKMQTLADPYAQHMNHLSITRARQHATSLSKSAARNLASA
ncbi:hypothetical protein M885DRAFT_477920 [Pelagophyceae sp. CCMP2097]|nr:hypothetical protein M885DRAFT_477920 [Pelagophyceae sp. CCMP2097]